MGKIQPGKVGHVAASILVRLGAKMAATHVATLKFVRLMCNRVTEQGIRNKHVDTKPSRD